MKKLFFAFLALFSVTACFASDCNTTQLADTYQYNLKPVTVYTGKTVIVKKHYAVYQPKVVYEKVDSYTTTKVCTTCK